MLQLRPEVQAFAQHMELKLRENDHKGGWKDMKEGALYIMLEAELHELQAALLLNRPMAVMSEVLDVANMGMMVCDSIGLLMVDMPDLDGVKQAILKVLEEAVGGVPLIIIYYRGMEKLMTAEDSVIGTVEEDGRIVTMPTRNTFKQGADELERVGMISRISGTETYILAPEEEEDGV